MRSFLMWFLSGFMWLSCGTGLYHMVHSDATVRERAQMLVERLIRSLVKTGKGLASPDQASTLGPLGGASRFEQGSRGAGVPGPERAR